MSKKKNAGPHAEGATPAAKKHPARRSPVRPENSQLKTTIMSAPRALDLYSSHSFMRTTAFTLQNKVKTAITGLKNRNSRPIRRPDPRLNLSFGSSAVPTSSHSFFSKPMNRLKIALLTLVAIAGIGLYKYSHRDSATNLSGSASVAQEKNKADPAAGVEKENLARRAEGPATLASDRPSTAKATDSLSVERAAPATRTASKVAVESKQVKSTKAGKKAKSKASRAKSRKARSLAH